MVSAAELIEALQRRLRLVAPHTRLPPGQFPPGWQAWLESFREQPGRVTGATSESLVAALAQRPLAAAPRRLGELTQWQAFATIWRQQWQPATREDRHWRWFAAAVSLLWHLFVGLMLLWLMYVSFSRPAPQGESVVEVELIGTGTPDEAGGGAVSEPAPAAEAVPSARTAQATESRELPSPPPPPQANVAVETPAPTPTQPAAETPPSEQQPEPAPAQQAVTVSEPVPDASESFVLTPPVVRAADPSVAAPELRAPMPSVQVVEIPAPRQAAPLAIRAPQLTPPDLEERIPEVVRREIPAPIRAPTVSVPESSLSTPELQARIPQVRTATIPAPDRPAAAAPTAAAAAAQSAIPAPAAPAAAAAGAPAPPRGRSPATTAGAGPKPTPAPGSWATPKRADDWGDAARNRPGGRPGDDGLYNADGSVRLADTPGSASPGTPPGTVSDEIVDLDRAGTWLRRAPNDYEPTAFDRYWRPNETLLQEWVRKSIKTVRIPIPGTNKHIVCQTVLLALGGGCGITDPNLNEHSATARPPPDIPFKPELQEDNGSIRPPPGG